MFRIDDDFAAQELRSRMLLQVHDELVFEVAPGEWDAARARSSATAWATRPSCSVPLDVQIGRGANWDDAGH